MRGGWEGFWDSLALAGCGASFRAMGCSRCPVWKSLTRPLLQTPEGWTHPDSLTCWHVGLIEHRGACEHHCLPKEPRWLALPLESPSLCLPLTQFLCFPLWWVWNGSHSYHVIGEGNGNPLQCSCLENPRDGEAWWADIYGVAQSRTRLKRLSSSSYHVNSQD